MFGFFSDNTIGAKDSQSLQQSLQQSLPQSLPQTFEWEKVWSELSGVLPSLFSSEPFLSLFRLPLSSPIFLFLFLVLGGGPMISWSFYFGCQLFYWYPWLISAYLLWEKIPLAMREGVCEVLCKALRNHGWEICSRMVWKGD